MTSWPRSAMLGTASTLCLTCQTSVSPISSSFSCSSAFSFLLLLFFHVVIAHPPYSCSFASPPPPPSSTLPPRWPSGKASASRAEGPGFSYPACTGIFLGSSHTSDLNIGTPVATLPGAWRYRGQRWDWSARCHYTHCDRVRWKV